MQTTPHSNQQSSTTEETHLEFSLKQIAVHSPASAKSPAAPPRPKSESFMALETPTAASRSKLNLLGNGFLRRCQTGLFIGATGIGKSVAIAQAVFSWAVGRSFFGIRPQGPLSVLIVQSENDNEDMAEMRDGILAGLKLTPAELALARVNVRVMRSFAVGAEWLKEIAAEVAEHKPDLLIVDPLFAYAGVDLAKDQPGLSAFLRGQLLPFSIAHNLGVILVHHTNKPPVASGKSTQAAGDFAYAGSGHNELANFARFAIVVRSLGSRSVYELRIGKRYKRAGIVDDHGEAVDRLYIKHAARGIHWELASEEELAASRDQAQAKSSGRAKLSARADQLAAAFYAVQKNNAASLKNIAEQFGVSEKTIRRVFDPSKTLVVDDSRFQLEDGIVTRTADEAEIDQAAEAAA